MGLKEEWAKWTTPETPEPKRENCTDDEAMKIFSEELAVHIEEKHGPEPMGSIKVIHIGTETLVIDKEALIIGALCITLTAVAIIV